MMQRTARTGSLVLLILAVGFAAKGLYIPLKAWVAQQLLESAWDRRLAGGDRVRPWSWADTWPVARLQQRRLKVDQIVLSGASDRVLAFGPGHVSGTARPGESGNLVISGHRDTHFRWLADLRAGDELQLQLPDGRSLRYRVFSQQIRNRDDVQLLDPLDANVLRLVTCYPFEAIVPGGPLRYLVSARPLWY